MAVTYFGKTTYNDANQKAVNALYGFRFQNTAGTGTVTEMGCWFYNGTGTHVRLGVYADVPGSPATPGALLLDAGAIVPATGWVSITNLNLSVTADTYYWLAWLAESPDGPIVYTNTGPTSSQYYEGGVTYGALPNPFGTGADGGNVNFCIRAGVEAGGAIDLVPAEGMQEQVADAPALTQVHNLVVAEGMQVQTSDSPAVTQVHILTADEGIQAELSDTPALTQIHILAADEGMQVEISDSPALTQVHVLVTAEGNQIQASDIPALTQVHVLAAAEGAQEQVSDTPIITVGGVDLVAAEGVQVQVSDTPALTQVHILVPTKGVQAQASDSPILTQVHILAPAKGFQAQVSDAAILDLSILLATQKGYQAQYSDSPTLTVISAKVGTDSSLWASKKGLHKPLGKKWYKPGVKGQRWYKPSEKLFK